MPSLSFDPFAHIYDATRGHPVEVAARIAESLAQMAEATGQTRFLEVGIGTGRIALPLATLGHRYSGVDISQKMLAQLEMKLGRAGWLETLLPWGGLPDEDGGQEYVVRRFRLSGSQAMMRLVMADMTRLPFLAASFDVVIAVHVFHLVDRWQQAVQEVLRVLRPGGLLLHCWDEFGASDVQQVTRQWIKILDELGDTSQRPGAPSYQNTDAFLLQQGLQIEQVHLVTWERTLTPRVVLDDILQRHWSYAWVVPEQIFVVAAARLRMWALEYYGAAIDTPCRQERRFLVKRTVVSD